MFQTKSSPKGTTYQKPSYPTPDAASQALRDTLTRFLEEPWRTPEGYCGAGVRKPRVMLIQASTGLGKSYQARLMIRDYLQGNPERTVVVFVPTHRLGQEQVDAFISLDEGLVARRFLGTGQDDPDNPGKRMCHRADIVAALCANGVSMQNLCAKPKLGLFCPHHVDNPDAISVCGYSKQKKQRARAWFMPHQMLFHTPLKCVGDVGLVVIDEEFWSSAMSSSRITLSSLEVERKAHRGAGDEEPGAEAVELAHKTTVIGKAVAEAIRKMPDGFVRTQPLLKATSKAMDKAGYKSTWLVSYGSVCVSGEWSTFGVKVRPNSSRKELEKTADLLRSRSALKLSNFWRALDRGAKLAAGDTTPLLVKQTVETKDGPVQYVTSHWLEQIMKGWHLPTALLSATPSKSISEELFNEANYNKLEMETFTCPMQNTTVTQVIDSKLSKAMMVPTDTAKDRKNSERKKNLGRLVGLVTGLAVRGKTLLVTTMAIEKLIKDHLPKNVDILHYGAVSGLDEFTNHRVIILAGRLELPLRECEHQAGIIWGMSVNPVTEEWYETKEVGVETADEELDISIEATRHNNYIAEEVRWSWNEAELLQAIGRGRGVRRAADNPLEIFACTNVPLPIRVDLPVKWQDLVPASIELDIARDGVVCLSPMELVRVRPGRYRDRNAARYAIKKFRERYIDYPAHPAASRAKSARGGENAYISTLIGKFTPPSGKAPDAATKPRLFKTLLIVEYKRPLSGANWCRAVVRSGHGHPSARDCLEAVVGKVASYRLVCALRSDPPITPPRVQPGQTLHWIDGRWQEWDEGQEGAGYSTGNDDGRVFFRGPVHG